MDANYYHDFANLTWHHWRILGENKQEWYCRALITSLGRIYSVVAVVKMTNDGRYIWLRKRFKNFDTQIERDAPVQGVCRTLEDAKEKAIEDLQHIILECKQTDAFEKLEQWEKQHAAEKE